MDEQVQQSIDVIEARGLVRSTVDTGLKFDLQSIVETTSNGSRIHDIVIRSRLLLEKPGWSISNDDQTMDDVGIVREDERVMHWEEKDLARMLDRLTADVVEHWNRISALRYVKHGLFDTMPIHTTEEKRSIADQLAALGDEIAEGLKIARQTLTASILATHDSDPALLGEIERDLREFYGRIHGDLRKIYESHWR